MKNVHPRYGIRLALCPSNEQAQTFKELATKAQDMEVIIANHCYNSFSFAKLKKDNIKFKRNVKFSKNSTKETMSISKAEPVHIIGKPKVEDEGNVPFKDTIRRRPTLIEIQ